MQRKVLIFGAKGQLGHDLLRTLPPEFLVTGVGHETDITDRREVSERVAASKPDILINAAAYNKVEEAEQDPRTAYEVNAIGAHHLASVAKEHGIPILHVSTDYVFDGAAEKGFGEEDPTNPLNVYGASKEAGERLVRIANSNHWIIRTSALFGVNATQGKGYNFVTRRLTLAREQSEMRIVGDQWTAPTSTRDLAEGIKRILLSGNIPFGTYHLVNEGSTTWAGFTEEIFRIAQLQTKVAHITTKESGTTIHRPLRSVLRNEKLKTLGIELPPWEDGLKRYLEEIKAS